MSQMRINNSEELIDIYVDKTGEEIFPVPSHFAICPRGPSHDGDEQSFNYGNSKRKIGSVEIVKDRMRHLEMKESGKNPYSCVELEFNDGINYADFLAEELLKIKKDIIESFKSSEGLEANLPSILSKVRITLRGLPESESDNDRT
jgi:hypothetical protein